MLCPAESVPIAKGQVVAADQAQPELASKFGITAIPTLAIFRDGVLLGAQAGALPGPALDSVIDQVRKLDMAEVRKKVAELEKEDAAKAEPKA